MKKYEIMYILNSSVEEEARKALIEELHAIITNGNGTVDKVDEWGMKDFAYRIEDMTKGYYVVVECTANGAIVDEFARICRINPNVVRHMIVSVEQ